MKKKYFGFRITIQTIEIKDIIYQLVANMVQQEVFGLMNKKKMPQV